MTDTDDDSGFGFQQFQQQLADGLAEAVPAAAWGAPSAAAVTPISSHSSATSTPPAVISTRLLPAAATAIADAILAAAGVQQPTVAPPPIQLPATAWPEPSSRRRAEVTVGGAVHTLDIGSSAIVGRIGGEGRWTVAAEDASSKHLRLDLTPDGLLATDLHSSNGTEHITRGRAMVLPPGIARRLQEGDQLRIPEGALLCEVTLIEGWIQ